MKTYNGPSLFDFKYFFWIFLITLGVIAGFGYLFRAYWDLLDKYQALESSCSRISAENSELKGNVETVQTAFAQCQSILAASQGRLNTITTDLSACTVEKDQATAEIMKKDEELGQLHQLAATIQAKLDAAGSLISKLQSEVYRLYQERDYYRVAYTDAAQKIAELESQKPGEHENTPAIIRLLEAVFAKLGSGLFPLALGIAFTGAMSTTGLSVILRKLYLTRSRAKRHKIG